MRLKRSHLLITAIACHLTLEAQPRTASLPSPVTEYTIAGCIDAIHGDYSETADDLELSGSDSLSLKRTYHSK